MSRRSLTIVVALCAVFAVGLCEEPGKHHHHDDDDSHASKVTDKELQSLTIKLFSADEKALSKHVSIDLQGKTFSSAKDDQAPNHLLKVNDAGAKAANKNVALLAKLYDNYEPDCTKAEHVTEQEKQEQSDLLDGMLSTKVMQTTMDFLASKGLVKSDRAAQKEFLQKLWFSLYSRGGGALGSSAFEHVFLGELKHGSVSGLHSWLFFNNQEEKGKIDYKGYIKKLPLEQSGTLLKIRFTWLGANKPVNSLFVGASPELEMSLYTLCFLSRPDKMCTVHPTSDKRTTFSIQTWSFKLKDGFQTIGSAYPSL